ncbi:YggS family pyridoxal phosphate-dependent enzyme [Aeromonas veronii]|uniref:Pyridoxal phosphate homeostasis protein n=1 Tax=Aeromonas veronii TaxID=654 RepID=A0A2T4N0E7_AERVE|nr:YggS family pyridoxal phosphate-dependent enzyme [Aeromonas veronii]PTH80298.1 YggS family pyridoxal phosphate-dependent enzyme [Aeromonas veronii]RDE61841.1 YggS family pyridoxal phosphate-dependent enzyme [Aeromonas veronii]
MNQIAQHLFQVKERIAQAAERASRNLQQIRLLAVSKTKPVEAIMAAHAAGQRCFGESYAQEAAAKIDTLRQQPEYSDIEWHFIGPLQSNKSKLVAERFDWVQSVDRDKLIDRINNQRPASMAPLNVCLQINISGESSKSGTSEQEIFRLAELVSHSERLVLRGLMAIPEHTSDETILAAQMARMQTLFTELARQYPTVDTLSMGMTEDLELAIAHGSTMVRVGTAIFGAREYS